MSLLDKWSKKKEKEQLDAVDGAEATSDTKKKKVTKKAKKPTRGGSASGGENTSTTTRSTGSAYRVLISPLVSEKATGDEEKGVYTFIVAEDASKIDIRSAVTAVYGVEPIRVRTARYEGKRVRFGRTRGKRSDWKKAFVYLPKGKTIHIHEGV